MNEGDNGEIYARDMNIGANIWQWNGLDDSPRLKTLWVYKDDRDAIRICDVDFAAGRSYIFRDLARPTIPIYLRQLNYDTYLYGACRFQRDMDIWVNYLYEPTP